MLQRQTSCPINFQGDKLSQLDKKGLPPTQGRNSSLNGDFAIKKLDFFDENWQEIGCHQGAGSSLIKIGRGLVATRKLDLP